MNIGAGDYGDLGLLLYLVMFCLYEKGNDCNGHLSWLYINLQVERGLEPKQTKLYNFLSQVYAILVQDCSRNQDVIVSELRRGWCCPQCVYGGKNEEQRRLQSEDVQQ